MQAGTNTFPILVTDISGGPITGLTVADFDFDGQVGSTILNTPTVAESSTGGGYYLASVDIPVGQGFLSIEAVDASNKFVTPTFYTIDATIYDTDDIYASVARQNLELTQTALGVYESQDIGTFKSGDDWDFTYVVPDSVAVNISGYSDFKASLITEAGLTTNAVSGASYIGDFNLTVDTVSKSIRMIAPASITVNTVPEGSLETILYSDIQCLDDNGRKKTLAELTITVRRQFTYN